MYLSHLALWLTSYVVAAWMLQYLTDFVQTDIICCSLYVLFKVSLILQFFNYSAKKLRRVLETLCGAYQRCSRVRL